MAPVVNRALRQTGNFGSRGAQGVITQETVTTPFGVMSATRQTADSGTWIAVGPMGAANSSNPVNLIPVTPGRPVAFAFLAWSSDPARVILTMRAADGSFIRDVVHLASIATSPTGPGTWISSVYTPAANEFLMEARLMLQSVSVGRWIQATAGAVEDRATPIPMSEWFSGDSPGCKWLGPVNGSPSVGYPTLT